jgi:transcription elongation factor Elf1
MLSVSSRSEFNCPTCGAAAALWFPNADPQLQVVTLKCVSCATLMRLPKDKVVGAGSSGPAGGIGPSEVSSTL